MTPVTDRSVTIGHAGGMEASAKKPWVRRMLPDQSQTFRRALQLSFLAINVWIGVVFYRFIRQWETGLEFGIERPPGVEGWLPIAGMMNSRYFFLAGEIPAIHPAAMVLFLTFLALSLLMRKSFCGWLCPVGTLSEYLWKFGRSAFGRNAALPRWLDIPLRGLKYILLGLFVWAVGTMPAAGIAAFLSSPYGLIADVKMLDFFRRMSVTAAVIIGVLTLGSVFVRNFWCRYFCPYGALMGLAALASPLRIRRDPVSCIDCAKCAQACPSHLPVDKLIQIRSAECLGCMECVASCPAEGALWMGVVRTRTVVPAWAVALAVALLFLGAVGAAKATGHWHSPIPNEVYRDLVPLSTDLSHP